MDLPGPWIWFGSLGVRRLPLDCRTPFGGGTLHPSPTVAFTTNDMRPLAKTTGDLARDESKQRGTYNRAHKIWPRRRHPRLALIGSAYDFGSVQVLRLAERRRQRRCATYRIEP